jgi:RNA polymerase sigma-70 factor (ECF subfamily)
MDSGEGNLIAEAAAGKTAAFEKLTAPLADSLYSIIAGIVGQSRGGSTPSDAEDVLQETLLNAYKGMGGFRGESSFSTWMTRIAVNAARSYLRKKRPEVAPIPASDGEEDCPADPFDAMASPSPGPAEVLAMQEDKDRVGEALTKLPDEEREVLVMREVDGMKYSAIADALEITEGAVRARLHRARNRMFSLLGGLSATSRSATSSRPSGSRPSGRTQ